MRLQLILLTLAFSAFATPISDNHDAERELANFSCAAVTQEVNDADEQAAATSFCSSYLEIPVATDTATSTFTVIKTSTYSTTTVEASTVMAVETTWVTPAVTFTKTYGVTTTNLLVAPTGCRAPLFNVKRSDGDRPDGLDLYPSGSMLSSACSCLSVPTSTSTVTTGVTVTSTTFSTMEILVTSAVIPTTTATSTITRFMMGTTLTYVSTVPSSIATMTQIGPFKMVASGSTISGKYALEALRGDPSTRYVRFYVGESGAQQFYLRPNGELEGIGGGTMGQTCGSISRMSTSPSPCRGFTLCNIIADLNTSFCRLSCETFGKNGGNVSYHLNGPDVVGTVPSGWWAIGAPWKDFPTFKVYIVGVPQ